MTDGGPAFPIDSMMHSKSQCFGMTLRDYFAAKAMQGLLAGRDHSPDGIKWEKYAYGAYEMADAMLKAREAK